MKVRIRRGAHEIGGNCIELVADSGSRIVLDAGYPLDREAQTTASAPTFDGPLDAAIVSHPHLDHYGLIPDLGAPIYIGAEAERILAAAEFFSPMTRPLTATGHLIDREPLQIAAFTITPYLVDHSAFDAYALLVEADGKRIFYTGDFRGHGRKAALFKRLLAHPPRGVDVLLTEGTQMSSDHKAATESDLEAQLVGHLAETDGLVVVFGSAQNLDRLVTVYRAAKRAGRTFVTDLYGASVAAATRSTIPQTGFNGYQVYVPNRQRVLVKLAGEFGRVEAIKPCRVFTETLARDPGGYVAYLPTSAAGELIRANALTSTGLALWSMWDGYLKEPSGTRFTARLADTNIVLDTLHTSGHATVADIKRLIDALAPTVVVPIHTEAPEGFAALTDRVTEHADGEWWTP
jgi:ribonuclease J